MHALLPYFFVVYLTTDTLDMNKIFSTLLLMTLIILGSCCDCKKGEIRDLTKLEESQSTDVQNAKITIEQLQGQWNLVEMNGRDVSDFKATLSFKGNDVTIKTGCNTMAAVGVNTKGSGNDIAFDLSKSMSTLIGCPVDHIENELFSIIKNVNKSEQKKRHLILQTASNDKLILLKH